MEKEILIEDKNLAVQIQRLKGKNTSVRITSKLDIILRTSQNAKEKDIDRNLEKMRPWIEKTYKSLYQNYIEKQIAECSNFERMYYDGKCIEVLKTDFTKRIVLGEHSITIPKKMNLTKVIEELLILKKDSVTNRFIEYYELMYPGSNRIPKLEFKHYKSRWGVCYINRFEIFLNKKIIQLPRILQDYIIVHELLHLTYSNHGKKFKSTLQSYFPKRNMVQMLKEYAFLLED